MASLYEEQEEACQIFLEFDKNHQIKETKKPDDLQCQEGEGGKFYDITGQSAKQVIKTLVTIINDPCKWPTVKSITEEVKAFYFSIKSQRNGESIEIIYRLEPRPTENQPGNGLSYIVYLEGEKYEGYVKPYQKLIPAIAKAPRKFAEDIQKLFKDNSAIVQDIDLVVKEMYFLFLFEIARRRSNEENKTEVGKLLDKLPIPSAIASIVKLLQETDTERVDEDTLLKTLKSYFRCFGFENTDSCARKEAIIKLNDNIKKQSRSDLPMLDACKKQLEEMYW